MDFPMSGDEVWVAVISTGLAIYAWLRWYWDSSVLWPLRRGPEGRGYLWTAPVVAALLILGVLTTIASHDVVDDPRYIYLYFVLGLAWVGLATRAFPVIGLFLRDDVVERRNPAVGPALGGAVIGVAAAYAGGNIGDGPGWWVVVASALLATGALLGIWAVLDLATGSSDAITIDRDVAAGWRLGGFLVAGGLILGRSVAGDWVSLDATIHDALLMGWPVLLLLGIAVAMERTLHSTPEEPRPPVVHGGILPAIAMVGTAIAWLLWSGIPE